MADGFARFKRGADGAQLLPAFTNRISETAAFDAAVSAHARHVRTIDACDVEAPRRNTLNFYGVGGIGKTTLLHELEQRLRTADPSAACLTVNFENPASFDYEELLLRMRASVGSLGIRCIAFDFALTYYWEVVHPGLTLDAYTRSSSMLRRVSGKLGVSEQVEASVVEVVSSIVSASQLVHGATRLAQAVKTIVTDRARIRHAIRDCPVLPDFLDSSTVEHSLSYMTALLAWDVERAGNPPVVFFFDTYEEVTRRGRQTEKIIQRFCYLLPNALFVVAGRNRLDWDDPNLFGTLDYVGPTSWPSLEGDGSVSETVVEVAELVAADADSYLRRRLVLDGEPAIPDGVRSHIVDAAEGWPLYLDVAVDNYRAAIAAGRTVDESLAMPFAALVARLSSDLTVEERTVLHVAALFSSFDEDLLTTSSQMPRNAVRRLMARSFVKSSRGSAWPHSLHQALREALRIDTGAVDSWTVSEWSARAVAAVAALRGRALATRDRVVLAGCITTALELGAEYDTDVSWLVEQCIRLAQWNGLGGVRYVSGSNTPAGRLSDLLEAVSAAALRPRAEVASWLQTALNPGLEPVERFWVKSVMAGSLLDIGEVSKAEIVYRDILADPPSCSLTRETRTMFALVLLKRGSFDELRAFCRNTDLEVDRARLLGDLHRHHAAWGEARECYELGLADAENGVHTGLAQLFRAELALVAAWTGEDPRKWKPVPEDAGTWSQLSYIIALALSEAGRDPEAAHRQLDLATNIASGFGLRESMADIAIARAFVTAVSGESGGFAHARADLERYVDASGSYRSWLAVVDCWRDEVVHAPTTRTDDLGSAAIAAWRQTLRTALGT